MDDLTKQLVAALRSAWHELNAIRARDGAPYHHDDGMPYCTEECFDRLVEQCDAAIEAATGAPPRPWPFKWELNDQDSAVFVDAVINPPKPNEALKAAASRYTGGYRAQLAAAQAETARLRHILTAIRDNAADPETVLANVDAALADGGTHDAG